MGFIILLSSFIISRIISGASKAIRDFTDNEDSRQQSILHSLPKDCFWGSKENNYKLKDRDKPVWDILFHTILVFFVDAWHMCDGIIRLLSYVELTLVFITIILLDFSPTFSELFILLGSYIIVNITSFHLFWSWIFRRDTNFKEYIKKTYTR